MRPLILFTLCAALALAACSDDSSDGDGGGGGGDGIDAAPAVGDGAPRADGPAPSDFVSFRYTQSAGPCPDNVDCSGFIELRADRTLLFDRVGELPVEVHEATVTRIELGMAINVLTDPDLIAILDLGEPPCVPPSDIFESMTLVLTTGEHMNMVTLCKDPSLGAAREALQSLTETYFPE